MDCYLPGSSVHGILQARILEWIAMPFSKLPLGTINLQKWLTELRETRLPVY